MAKKILYTWSDLFNDEDAVKYVSGCWPRALTNRWYWMTNVERRLTSPLVVASSECSRCSRTLVVFRKIVSEKKAKATQENTKEMLTAIDSFRRENLGGSGR